MVLASVFLSFALFLSKVTIRTRDLLEAKFKFVDSYDSQLANRCSWPRRFFKGASGTSWPTPQCNTERGRPRQRPSNPLFWIAISQGTTHMGGVDFINLRAFHEGWRRFHGLTPPGSLTRLKKQITITLRAVHGARNGPHPAPRPTPHRLLGVAASGYALAAPPRDNDPITTHL